MIATPQDDLADETLLKERLEALVAFSQRSSEENRKTSVDNAGSAPLGLAAYHAALHDTFEADGLSDADPAQRRDLLSRTEMVIVGGIRRLRLADDIRAQVIAGAWTEPAFQEILRQPSDRASTWMRRFLLREHGDLGTAAIGDLRAALTALERLSGMADRSGMPSIEEVKRRLNLAELLEPLRILIGSSDEGDVNHRDRFVGRTDELRVLRSFVDELASHSFLETVTRSARRVGESIGQTLGGRSPGVMVWSARGGLGKTALIAKFVLDHAPAQSAPFPFAYLDFDRGSLQPREPRALLVEIAGQVALQFPAAELQLSELRSRLRAELADPQALRLSDPYGDLRAIITDTITGGSRAFLLVLDTVEVVQYDARSLAGVVKLVDSLYGQGFPELRVVAAGRADVPDLRRASAVRREGELKILEPLDSDGAVDMANALGRALLQHDWRDEWARRIVGGADAPVQRREPLSVRVAVELITSTQGEAARDKLAREIETKGEDAHEDFVAALYEKRVLEHVRDQDVRALAWPGLILRRVTLEIVRDLLAEPCGLTPERAERAFDGLAREVWIVERKGDALQHRADLRARTLPLMRRHERKRFDVVNAAATDYFGSRRADPVKRAEWLYHRLLGGEAPSTLERDWSDEVGSLLAGAEADLEPDTPGASFLAALTSTQLLSADRLAHLPPRLALEHVARTAPQLGDFDDSRLLKPLLQLELGGAGISELSGEATAAAVTLAVKTGRWRGVPPRSVVPGSWRDHQEHALRYLRARARQGEFDVTPQWELTEPGAPLALRALAHDLASARLFGWPSFEETDGRLYQALARPSTAVRDTFMLRLVMVFGALSFEPAVRCWTAVVEDLASSKRPMSLSLAEIAALMGPQGRRGEIFASLLKEAGVTPRDLVSPELPPRRIEHDALPHMVGSLIASLATSDPLSVRLFAAATDKDWRLPVAYAAHRAVTGGGQAVPPAVVARIESYEMRSGWLTRTFRGRQVVVRDVLHALRRADEAGDFAGMMELLVRHADTAAATDLLYLREAHADWRRRIGEMLGRPAAGALTTA